MTDAIIVALIGAISSIVLAFIAWKQSVQIKTMELHTTEILEKKEELRQENRKLKLELSSLTILFDYYFYSLMQRQVDEIFNLTKADRFMVLFAINGKTDFNYVSVAYEQTRTADKKGAISRYVRLEIDRHYKDLLKDVERSSPVVLETAGMPESLLKNIYLAPDEQVHHCTVNFLCRIPVDEHNDIVIYTSTATMGKSPFTNQELASIKTRHDRLRAHATSVKVAPRI
jgi:hypothetical protein